METRLSMPAARRRPYSFPLVISLALLWLTLAGARSPVHAADITVNDASDTAIAGDAACTLREAIHNANTDNQTTGADCVAGNGADTITFDGGISGSTITLAGNELALTSTLTIDGGSVISVSGNNASRVFSIDASGVVTLTGLIVRDGSADNGGGIHNLGDATISSAQVVSNTATSRGGGIYSNGAGAVLSVDGNSQIAQNQATVDGGGIVNFSGRVMLSDVRVLSNTAQVLGGGLYNFGSSAMLSVTGSTLIQNNEAVGASGGGLYNNDGRAALSSVQMLSNTAGAFGGGIYNTGGSSTVISVTANSLLQENRANSRGGGIYNNGGRALLYATQLLSNTASVYGGGIYNTGGSSAVISVTANSLVQGNGANANGGGIYNDGGQAILSVAQLLSNTATTNGGGIYNNGASAVLSLKVGSLLQDNRAGSGGGIFNDSGQATLSAAQLLSNTANVNGGGIYNFGASAVLSVTDGSLIQDNRTGSTDGGGIYNRDGQARLSAIQVLSNTASNSGGGLYNTGTSAVLSVTDGSLIQGNRAIGNAGGGIYNNQGQSHLSMTQVRANSANQGGGVYNNAASVTTLSTVQVVANSARTGGGILNGGVGAAVTITAGSLVYDNQATSDHGGGVYNNGRLTLSDVEIISNTTTVFGGGIYNSHLTTISNAQIVSNTAARSGGGYYVTSGSLVMSDTAVVSNTAQTERGGGVYLREDSTADIANSTLSGNASTQGNGGGLYVGGVIMNNTVTLTHVSIVDNYAAGQGGGIDYNRDHPGDVLTLRNTIVAGNRAGGSHQDCYDNDAPTNYTFNNDGNNLFGGATGDDCPAGASDLSLTALGITISDVLELDVADNGGDTLTHALLPGSVAIDGADSAFCTPADQRGQTRPGTFTSLCDIGAFEAQGVQPNLGIEKTVNNPMPGEGDVITYTIVVSNNGSYDATGGVISDVLPSGVTGVPGSAMLDPAGAGTVGMQPHLVTGLTITAGTSVTLTVQVTVDPGSGGQTITNTAWVTSTEVSAPISDSTTIVSQPIVCFAEIDGDNTTDFASADASAVRQAIDAAPADGTVKLAGYCAGVGADGWVVGVSKVLTVTGGYTETDWLTYQSGVYTATLDALSGGRVITVAGSSSVTPTVLLRNLLIENGAVENGDGAGVSVTDAAVTVDQSVIRYSHVITSQGGGLFANRTITVSNSAIYSNSATYDNDANPVLGYGGGLFVAGAELDNVTVNDNSASYAGGGVFNNRGLLNMRNGSRVENNDSGAWGGGLHNNGGQTVVHDSSQVSYNSSGRGGGIYSNNTITNSAHVTLTGSSQVQGNWSAFFAGGIFNIRAFTETRSVMAMQGASRVYDNESDGDGGGVYNWGYSDLDPGDGAVLLILDNSQIVSNTGKNGGGVYLFQNSVITATTGQIISNTAREKGGAIYIRDGFLDFTATEVISNVAAQQAGGIYLERGSAELVGVQVNENHADGWGGGLYVDAGTLSMIGGQINQNSANNQGGGIRLSANGRAAISGTLIMTNTANTGGGVSDDTSPLTLTHVIIGGNIANTLAGGIHNQNARVLVQGGSIISNTSAGHAGGIYLNQGTLEMSDVRIEHNEAVLSGGGLYNFSGQATLTRTIVSSNLAPNGGAGIRNHQAAAVLTMAGGQIVSNTTSGNGGGILHNNGSVHLNKVVLAYNEALNGGAARTNNGLFELVNSTISTNSVTGDGGGLYTRNGTVVLTSTTLSDNAGPTIFRNGSGSTNLYNTIIANSVSGDDCASTLVSHGYNLSSDSSCTDLTATGDITNTDPLLGPLADNGGNTLTHAPLAGSATSNHIPVAVNGCGTTVAEDQRGVARPQGVACNIGAYEADLVIGLCSAEIDGDNATDFSSNDAAAVQAAIDAVATSGTVKLAGYCQGVTTRAGADQTGHITKSLTLRGGYTVTNWLDSHPITQPTTLDADVNGRVLTIDGATIDVTVENLRLINGSATVNGGGIHNAFAQVTLSAIQVLSNTASDSGGGIFNFGPSAVLSVTSNSLIQGNTASSSGGGVANVFGQATLSVAQVLSNTGGFGGGLYNSDSSAALTVTGNSVIRDNTASNSGGGLFISDGQVTLSAVQVLSNTAVASGGALHQAAGETSVTQSCIVGNSDTAVNYAGGVSPMIATSNWWGSISGPSGAGPGSGDSVSANVDFSGFETASILGCPTLPLPELNIAKSVTDPAPSEGNTITYTIVVSNSGAGDATGGVISDVIPTGVTGVVGSAMLDPAGAGTVGMQPHLVSSLRITAGASVTLTVQVTVDIGTQGLAIANTAWVTSTESASPISDSARIDVPVTGPCFATPDDGATVFGSTDAHAVQQAVDAALSAGHVKVAGTCVGVELRDGTLQSSYISKTLTLSGGYTIADWLTSNPVANPTVIDAAGGGRVLRITGAVPVEIVALTLQGGQITGEGGGAFSNGALTLTRVHVMSNTASTEGGGVWASGAVTAVDSRFQDNRSTTNAGGGLWTNATLSLTNTDFISNTASIGAGGAGASGAVTAVNSLFQGNSSKTDFGGGLLTFSTLSLTNTHFLSNTADLSGGGAFAIGAVTAVDSRFENNTSTVEDGGGLYANAMLNLTNTDFLSNTARFSGGGAFAIGAVTAVDSLFQNNTGTVGDGGGVQTLSTLSLTNTHFISNTAIAGVGGGAYAGDTVNAVNSHFERNTSQSNNGGALYTDGPLTLEGSQFTDNEAWLVGGGVFAAQDATVLRSRFEGNEASVAGGLYGLASVQVSQSEFLANTAVNGGGGLSINNAGAGAGRIVNTLFARNRSLLGIGNAANVNVTGFGPVEILFTTVTSPTLASGSAIEVGNGSVAITDTIVASHTVGIQQTGGTVTEDYNLFFGNGADTAGAVGGGANSVVGDPAFANPAADDYHLTAGSAAINIGVDVGVYVDFEDEPRPQAGGFDAGYDESPFAAGAPALSIAKTVDENNPETGDTITYTVVVSNGGDSPATGGVIRDPIPAGVTYVAASAMLDPPGAGTVGTPPDLVTGLTITAGTSVTLTFQATVNGGLTTGLTITNTASVTATNFVTPTTGSVTLTVDSPEVEDITVELDLVGMAITNFESGGGGYGAGILDWVWTILNPNPEPVSNIYFDVVQLSPPGVAVVHNADGGPAGQGARVSVPNSALGGDNQLTNGETYAQLFEIGWNVYTGFTFQVRAFGVVGTPLVAGEPQLLGTFTVELDPSMVDVDGPDQEEGTNKIFLPLIRR